MPELLLEVGCEELPASFVAGAVQDLAEGLRCRLVGEGLLAEEGEVQSYATPRRLILAVTGVLDQQPDRPVEQRGPALQAAYDGQGQPSQALLGFCRSQGVDPASLRKDEKYVWADKVVKGMPAVDVLSTLLPEAIRSLKFEKSMRWGSSKMRFARPIRWILACFGSEVVPFEIEGVVAGCQSRGHRFYADECFEARSMDALLDGLRKRSVEPDPAARRERIVGDAARIAGGAPDLSHALVDENVYLTEWPTAIKGSFSAEFAKLPEPVLVTAMAKHEKCFPVRGSAGRLTNDFIAIRNSGEDESVRRGYEWVLNARFNDAQFFFEEDARTTLEEFLQKTSGILFQEKLGTVRARAERLSKLAAAVARANGASEAEVGVATVAGRLAKADLSTGLVGEFASLQGVVGAEYAARDGFSAEICDAIRSQYALDPRSSVPSRALFVADAMDKLAGYLGVGLVPSGSSDPYGLRRAATGLIEAGLTFPMAFPSYRSLFRDAVELYEAEGVALDSMKLDAALLDLFVGRYQALYEDLPHYVLDAAMLVDEPEEVLSPRRVALRLQAVAKLAEDVSFVRTATRPANIIAPAYAKGIITPSPSPLSEVASTALDSAEGTELLDAVRKLEGPLGQAALAGDSDAISRDLLALAGPINKFFDSTMVMVEDPVARTARLRLLEAANRLLRHAGDFTKIVIEG